MAVTVALITTPAPSGNLREVVADVTMDSSYASAGEPITPSAFGLSAIHYVAASSAVDGSGNFLLFGWDATNSKLRAFYPSGGGAASPAAVAQPVSSVVPDTGSTTMTGSVAKPVLTATKTPGAGKEVLATTDLSGFVVRVRVVGV